MPAFGLSVWLFAAFVLLVTVRPVKFRTVCSSDGSKCVEVVRVINSLGIDYTTTEYILWNRLSVFDKIWSEISFSEIILPENYIYFDPEAGSNDIKWVGNNHIDIEYEGGDYHVLGNIPEWLSVTFKED